MGSLSTKLLLALLVVGAVAWFILRGNNGTAGLFSSDLTRTEVARVLNSPDGRGYACNTSLSFREGAFEKAEAANLITHLNNESGLMGQVYHAADLPGGDRWQILFLPFNKEREISRKVNSKICLNGKAEAKLIAEVPFGPGAGGGFKAVEYVEVVDVPQELKPLIPYVYTRYEKSTVFQRTDQGWRIAK